MARPQVASSARFHVVSRRLLVVCTANVCRSPVAERLLSREFGGVVDIDGETWVVTSAGTGQHTAELDRNTVAAADDIGINLRTHKSRWLNREILSTDGADLVVAMARRHLPTIVELDPAAWPRTFTLKELARRAFALDAPTPAEGFAGWLGRMAAERQARDVLKPDPRDDIADPYGLPKRHHVTMVAEVQQEVERLLKWGPWII